MPCRGRQRDAIDVTFVRFFPGGGASGTLGSEDAGALAEGLNEVGFDLFAQAAGEASGDVVLSPLSIGLAFGMADVGATGATADALRELFAYPVDGEERWSAFNTLDQDVTDVGEPVVRLANRQYPDVSFDTAPGYDQMLRRWFGTGIEPLPLQDEPEPSRARINEWVAEQTEQLIPELLPAEMVGAQSVMVLVNALYLEADWERPSGKYPTEDAPFTRLDGSQVTVPLMHERELSGPAVVTDTYAATEIPYEDGQLSMLVIVPEDGHYPQVEDDLSNDLVAEIDAAATDGVVQLWLPRFESDTRCGKVEPGGGWRHDPADGAHRGGRPHCARCGRRRCAACRSRGEFRLRDVLRPVTAVRRGSLVPTLPNVTTGTGG